MSRTSRYLVDDTSPPRESEPSQQPAGVGRSRAGSETHGAEYSVSQSTFRVHPSPLPSRCGTPESVIIPPTFHLVDRADAADRTEPETVNVGRTRRASASLARRATTPLHFASPTAGTHTAPHRQLATIPASPTHATSVDGPAPVAAATAVAAAAVAAAAPTAAQPTPLVSAVEEFAVFTRPTSASVVSFDSAAFAIPTRHRSATTLMIGSNTPPALTRPQTTLPGRVSPAPTPPAPALTWVSHTNRDLVRLAFTKRIHVHRGLLEPRFEGLSAPDPSAKKNASTGGNANPFLLQAQLATAPAQAFHVCVHGTAASGKTSTLHNLSGRPVPPKHHETSGMHLLDLTWPYKSHAGEVTLCDLLFWDSGHTASQQYKYIATTPETRATCCLYIVSCLDRASWTAAMKKLEEDGQKRTSFAKLLILTKIDERHKREVHEADILVYQDAYNKQHYPTLEPFVPSNSTVTHRSYSAGSLVVCKLANWPISSEPFYTRPGVSSMLNTIAAMCIANARQQITGTNAK